MLSEHRFRAMNTGVATWLWSTQPDAEAPLLAVERFFHQVERELSRFQATSGLSRLNAAAGTGPQPVSPLLQTVLALALRQAAASGGIFDPTLLHALQGAGYDRTFEQIGVQGRHIAMDDRVPHTGGWKRIIVDQERGTVALPADVGLDLGGIGKGWAVDRAAETLGGLGPSLVDAGGDIRAAGTIDGEGWPIAVQDPFDDTQDLMVLRIAQGAIATSSVGGRRWQRNGQTFHHLIDPRTGRPSDSDLHTVTVLAPTAVEAEVAAKVALILGIAAGSEYLAQRRFSGLLITHTGARRVVGSLPVDDMVLV